MHDFSSVHRVLFSLAGKTNVYDDFKLLIIRHLLLKQLLDLVFLSESLKKTLIFDPICQIFRSFLP